MIASKLMMDDEVRFAGQAGIERLFHYQDFNPPNPIDVERLTDILTRNRIFCSDPTTFNDPWDCKPYFDPALLDDPVIQAGTAESFIATQKGGPKGDIMDHLLRTNPALLKQLLQGFSANQVEFISKRWGVYCLTSDSCSTLMWSHYSRNHRGICLEFAVENTHFRAAHKVQYQTEYPRLLLHDENSRLKILLIKSDDWSYEQEFRLICPRFTDLQNHPLFMQGDYLPIGPMDLRSIILGCQAGAESIQTIRRLVEQYAPQVLLRQTRRAPNKYRLTVEDLVL
jgi:hypothetical protein